MVLILIELFLRILKNNMPYAKNQKEAIYRVGLKHELRKKGITGWRKNSSTKNLEKKLKKS